jgi:hypothetical protein
MEIPLKNRKGEIIANAIVDEDDFEKVKQLNYMVNMLI